MYNIKKLTAKNFIRFPPLNIQKSGSTTSTEIQKSFFFLFHFISLRTESRVGEEKKDTQPKSWEIKFFRL